MHIANGSAASRTTKVRKRAKRGRLRRKSVREGPISDKEILDCAIAEGVRQLESGEMKLTLRNLPAILKLRKALREDIERRTPKTIVVRWLSEEQMRQEKSRKKWKEQRAAKRAKGKTTGRK